MKRIILSILAVVAAGGLASAQVDQGVSTTVGSSTTFTVNNATVALTLNTTDSTTSLSYSTNDGLAHNITASASAWGAPLSATEFPTLSANGSGLINAANTAAAAQVIGTAAANTASSLSVSLLAASTAVLPAGSYTTTVTYTLN